MHTSYHNSRSANLQSIDTGAGQYAGIFVTDVISHTRDGAYGNHVYRVTYETICTYSDTVDFLWSEAGREFMAAHDLEEDDIDTESIAIYTQASFDLFCSCSFIQKDQKHNSYHFNHQQKATKLPVWLKVRHIIL